MCTSWLRHANSLSPDKTVLCPDLNAGCSLADSCKAEDLKKYKAEHPGYKVVSYVNTTAAVKALTDCVVTSGNAKKVIDSFPQDEKIIFGPDYNLGNYINSVTGRNMLLWNGGCHVHEKFSVEAIVKLKQEHPEAVVMAHLECKAPVLGCSRCKGFYSHHACTMPRSIRKSRSILSLQRLVSCTNWSAIVLMLPSILYLQR